ncbi:MAG: hypothetical protein AAGJ28_02450 [Pseudomonadota bacterium]
MSFGLLDRATATEPGVVTPTVSLSFGAAGGGLGGGLGGLGDALGGALGLSGGAGLAEGLVSLSLSRGAAPHVNWGEFVVIPIEGGAGVPSVGDEGTISFSAGKDSGNFSCIVDMVEARADGSRRLTVSDGGRALARARMEQSFADQTPGAIIASLCGEAEVQTSAGSEGGTMPQYVADGGRSLLDHVARLAQTAGKWAIFDGDGKLSLIDDTAGGEAAATLTMGGNLIDARTATRMGSGSVAIDGAGVGERGGNSWAWLRKEAGPHRAEAGDGATRRIPSPWVRSPDDANTLAGSRARLMGNEAAPGRFLAVSAAGAEPGALVDVQGTDQDGQWRVISQAITWDRETGFLNEITAAPAASGGLGGVLGGLF